MCAYTYAYTCIYQCTHMYNMHIWYTYRANLYIEQAKVDSQRSRPSFIFSTSVLGAYYVLVTRWVKTVVLSRHLFSFALYGPCPYFSGHIHEKKLPGGCLPAWLCLFSCHLLDRVMEREKVLLHSQLKNRLLTPVETMSHVNVNNIFPVRRP